MLDETVRVGIVGAGGNTRARHIPGLRACDGVEIVSVCNRRRESSENVAKEFEIPTVYDDWESLVEAEDTDAIVIGTWPVLHCPVTLAALAADKHVLCEARMAMNAGEAHAMYNAACERPHLVTQVVPSPFTLREDAALQRLLAEGFVGDITAIEARAGNGFLDREAPLHWRQDRELSGLNTLGLGIWYEAIMRWVGPATKVAAMGRTYVRMRKDPDTGVLRATDVPEHVDVVAEMACGGQLHIMNSKATGHAGPPEFFVFGSEGTLRLSEHKLYGGRREEDGLQELPIAPEEEGGWRVEEEFVQAIRGQGVISKTTFAAGVRYMEFTEAAVRSMQEGRTIPLPL